MSCRIYTATNANCLVGGQPPADEEATVRRDFEAGVSLVVDTTGEETMVRGAIPARRDAPEALVGIVTVPDGDDPLRRYHDAVREVFDERTGWRVRTDVVNGQLFEALGRTTATEPTDELRSSIRAQRRDGERVEVGVPDPRNTVGLLRSLLEEGTDDVYVVSTQEPPDHVDSDVFVHLADRYGTPELIDLETDLSPTERIDRRVDELVDELPPPAVATRLESETRKRDVPVGFEAGPSRGGVRESVLAGVTVGLGAAVLLAGAGVAVSGGDVTLVQWLPVVGSTTLPPWLPLLAGVLGLAAAASAPAVRRLLVGAIGVDAVLDSGGDLAPDQRERAETIAAILERHSLDKNGDAYRAARSALETQPIQPVRRSGVRRLTGVVALVVPAVVLVVVAWLLLGPLSTATVATGLFALGAVAVVGRVGLGLRTVGTELRKLLAGRSSERESQATREPEPQPSSESDDGQSDLGIRPVDESEQSEAADRTGSDRSAERSETASAEPDAHDGDARGQSSDAPPAVSTPDDGSDGEQSAETTGTVDPIAGQPSDGEGEEVSDSTSDADGSSSTERPTDPDTDDAAGETLDAETGDDDPADLFESGESSGDEQPSVGDSGEQSPAETGEPSTPDTARSSAEDRTDRSADEAGEVPRSGEPNPPSAGSVAATRGPFEMFFDELPVTTAPVVTDDRVFVAGDAGFDEISAPVDRSWLPDRHLDTLRGERTRAHLTRLHRDGEPDGTVPFTNTLAEPIVGGDGAVYVADSSSTVAALDESGGPAIETFPQNPTHFSGDHLLYVSDRETSRFLGPDLQEQYRLSGVLSVPPMVTDDALTVCLEDGQTRRIDKGTGRTQAFSTPGETLVGSTVVGETPYVASESGNVWAGWQKGWKDPTRIRSRIRFKWFSANDGTLVLSGRSIIYAREAGARGVDSLERTVSSPPVVTGEGVYFESNGELVRADLKLATTASVDLPWSSIDGLAAGSDRLYVVANGAVWTVPFSTFR